MAVMALRAMAALCLIVGTVVLVSIATHQARQRRRDTALLKVLGAEFSKVRALWSFEFGLLGTLATGLGLAASLGLSYLFAELVFDSHWIVDWRWPAYSALIVPTATAALASLSTLSALRESPQSLLQRR